MAKTIKTYKCKCGEDFYENDDVCINCGAFIDRRKLKEVEVAEAILSVKEKSQKYGKSPVMTEWNRLINNEITKLYQTRTNVNLLLRNNGDMEEIIDYEIQVVIDKLSSLKR